MKYVLSRDNLDLLAQLAWSRVLLGFDFDGTLAPIVPHRGDAAMRPRTRRLLAQICVRYPCAIISGRSRADLSRRLKGTSPLFIVGNHGMEPDASTDEFAALTRQVERELKSRLSYLFGVEFENKRFSLSIHYRRACPKEQIRAEIERSIARVTLPVRIVQGKSVINVLPAAAPNKGDALTRLRSLAGADTALFVGDDLTDEDIFALDQPGRLLSVRIGLSRSSAAGYFLRNQREIDDLLSFLSRCRAEELMR